MKSLRLSDLRKRSNKWFRDYGIVNPKGKSMKALRYIAERSFNAIPKKYRKYIADEYERTIETTIHSIKVDGESGKWDIYQSMFQRAKYQYEHSGDRTAEYIYKAFREQKPDVYSHFNSYVYRLGYSASQYFKDNFTSEAYGKKIYVNIDLPNKSSGVIYNTLFIEFDWSGDLIIYADMT